MSRLRDASRATGTIRVVPLKFLYPFLFLFCVGVAVLFSDNGLRRLTNGESIASLRALPTSSLTTTLAPSIIPSRPQTDNGDALYTQITSFSINNDFPQQLIFGPFNESAYPFISCDIWADLVDNKRTFLLRDWEEGFPGYIMLKQWIAARPHPITFLFNNQIDRSWPWSLEANDWKDMLTEPNLHAVFVGGLREFDHEFRSKVKPLPLGLKWQYGTTAMHGEPKSSIKKVYSSISKSPQESARLFESTDRTNTVWIRPMSDTNGETDNYEKSNAALSTLRSEVAGILLASAPDSTVRSSDFLNRTEYLEKLKTHRFMANPAGNGLDTHSTWEALLAGCIPINPHSPLDPLFENLPVWLVHSWDEVTDDAVKYKTQEMSQRAYDWSLIFAEGWRKKIHAGLPALCEDIGDTDCEEEAIIV